MVVDSSVLTAILLGEPDRDLFEDLLLAHPGPITSAIMLVEVEMVMRVKRPLYETSYLDRLLSECQIQVRPFDEAQARIAQHAFRQFGKGRHPARLNFGDCMVYALAKAHDDDLLFKGDDFALTDIRPAWRPEGMPR